MKKTSEKKELHVRVKNGLHYDYFGFHAPNDERKYDLEAMKQLASKIVNGRYEITDSDHVVVFTGIIPTRQY